MTTPDDSRVRVLQVTGTLYFGGAEKVVSNISQQFDRERFEMAVACTHYLGPLAEVIEGSGVPVTLLNTGRRSAYMRPRDLAELITQCKPDVVHSHGLQAIFAVGPLAMWRKNWRWIHTFHYGNYPYAKRRYMFLERLYSRWVDQLVAVAEPQRQALITHHGFRPDRIVTLQNGVPGSAFLNDPDVRARKCRELGLSPDRIIVGTIAVLTEQKGIEYLVEAARMLRSTVPEATFLVVGDGTLLGALRQRVAAMGLESTVTFTGWRSDVPELLATMDIWVMSSLWEAMPLALLEAMAAARPIVVTDVGDNRRIVLGGEAATVIPPRDAAAIAAAVADLIRHPDRARALGARALRAFDEHYTVSRMVSRYEAVYADASRRASPVAARPLFRAE